MKIGGVEFVEDRSPTDLRCLECQCSVQAKYASDHGRWHKAILAAISAAGFTHWEDE